VRLICGVYPPFGRTARRLGRPEVVIRSDFIRPSVSSLAPRAVPLVLRLLHAEALLPLCPGPFVDTYRRVRDRPGVRYH